MEAISQNDPDDERHKTYLKTENGKEVEIGVLAPKVVVRSDKKGYIYVPFLDERTIDYIAALIFEMVNDGFDCIVMITGRRRTGKSTLGAQIARKVDPDFPVKNVAFRVEAFSEILESNPFADAAKGILPQALYDEAGHGLYSKEWMALWVRNLVKCLEVIGMKQEVCYFILPHMKKLTGDIRDEMCHIWIDVDTKYKHERGYAELYMGIRNKFDQSIWWNPKCAFKFNELEDEWWAEYTAKKMAFVNEIAAEKIDSNQTSKDAERLDVVMSKMHRQNVSFKDIGEQFDLSESQVCRRVNRHQSSNNNPGPSSSA